MTQVVVDTDVVSFLFKNHPIGLRYDPELAGRVALISFMTVAEVGQDGILRGGCQPSRGPIGNRPAAYQAAPQRLPDVH